MNFHSPIISLVFVSLTRLPSYFFFSHSPLLFSLSFSLSPVYRYLRSVSLRFVQPLVHFRWSSNALPVRFSLSRLLLFHLCRTPTNLPLSLHPSPGFTENDNGKEISFHELSTSTHFLYFPPLFRIRGYHADLCFTIGKRSVAFDTIW